VTALPAPIAAALRTAPDPDPALDRSRVIEAAGVPFAVVEWGDPAGPPVVLVHGVTSSVETWWRIGPAIAASGHRVVAMDLPGHGRTGHWNGHHRFRAAAADLAAFIRAAGLDRPDLRVVGHSFGAMAAAALPISGLSPRRLVLLDPPAAPRAGMRAMAEDPVERHYASVAEGAAVIGAAYPEWVRGDVIAKAIGLHRVEEAAARAILLENSDWDGGVADLAAAAADRILPETWVVRADPAAGGLTFDPALPALAHVVGRERIITLAGASHSPQRTHPVETVGALLEALGIGPGGRTPR
jgi:pimeloyl-ACP methyl ester carboxylesterase